MLNQRSWGPLHRGFSEDPLGRVWPSLPHLISNPLGVCWQLPRGFSEWPLSRVWPSLPHLVSRCLEFYWQLLWDPNSTELNNNLMTVMAQWDLHLFHIISLNPPTWSLSITGRWNVSLPSGVLPWNSIFGLGRIFFRTQTYIYSNPPHKQEATLGHFLSRI